MKSEELRMATRFFTLHSSFFIRLAALALSVACLAGCAAPPPPPVRQASSPPPPRLTPAPGIPGDPESGRRLFTDNRVGFVNGCAGCHTLRGVQGATGIWPGAPNLTNVTLRPTLGGEGFQNTPENMRRWIMDPPSMKPGAAMPKLQVTEQQAQDLTAFLYSQPLNPTR